MNTQKGYGAGDATQLRSRADGCRQLANVSEDANRKALWIERADHWEKLAKEAEKRLTRKARTR